jgi:ketosteroid isomerase-like protein
MKKTAMLFLFILFFIYFSCQKTVDLYAEKEAVQTALNNFVAALENEDLEQVSNLVDHDADLVAFGTGEGQGIIGWDAFRIAVKQQNELLSDTKVSLRDMKIKLSSAGKFAYVTARMDVQFKVNEKPLQINGVRSTYILEKRAGDWKIVHTHDSIGSAE